MEILDDNQHSGLRFHYNLKVLSNITIVTVCLAILIIFIRMFAVVRFQSLYNGIKTDYSKYADLVWYGNFMDMLSILMLFVSVISWIPFFMWLYRAYYNLDVVKLKGLNVVSGWAVGWFFIPFANLYYSVVVINDLFRGTKHLATGGTTSQSIEYTPQVPYGILWLIFRVLAGGLSYLGLYRVARGNVAVLDQACFYEILSTGLNVISGLIILYLVFWVSKKQNEIMNSEIVK